MDSAELVAFWNSRFPACPPVGWLLRETQRQRWLRVHSLPESKRHAETNVEYDELLRRHGEVASEILGTGSCGLAVPAWADDPNEVDWCELIRSTVLNLDFAPGWSWHGDDAPVQIGVARVEWHAGRFASLLRAVADSQVSSIAFFSMATGEVYAPYDGGADIIVSTPERKLQLRDRWRSWLSARPDGL